MVYLMFGLAAVSAYLISGINPAIIMSKAIYHRDIRECGSKNPGFTNFRRSFSKSLAWVVLVLDLLKSALPAVSLACLSVICTAYISLALHLPAFALCSVTHTLFGTALRVARASWFACLLCGCLTIE